jgi:hypothetical protein
MFLEFQDTDHGDEKTQCNCLQNCLDSNVIVEKFQVLTGTKTLLGSIGGLVIMKKYPLIRFQREIIFTLTDFFGESFITVISYFFLLLIVCYSCFFKSQLVERQDSLLVARS